MRAKFIGWALVVIYGALACLELIGLAMEIEQ